MDKVLEKMVSVDEVPKAKRGGLKHNWKPVLDKVVKDGLMKISEDDVSIQSALNGLKKEAEYMKIDVALNTRKINGKVWLFIQIPRKNLKK